jgi:hypothetical protein
MPQYVVLADHTPDLCPTSNAKTRARAMEGLNPDAQQKALKASGVTLVFGPMHLDPSHRTVVACEAPSVEAVVQFVYESGLFQWNTVEVSPITPIEEMMGNLQDWPIVYT